MANIIAEGDRSLVSIDYSSLLSAILESLQETNPFRISKNGCQLFADIDEIAYSVAISEGSKIPNILGTNWRNARVATTNFTESSKDSFVTYNRAIRDCLQQHLETLLQENNYESIENYLQVFWTELNDFQGKVSDNIKLDYDFQKKYAGLSKQQLTLKREDNENPLLKFHRLTISIKNPKGEFDLQLKESLSNYIQHEFSNDRDELSEILDDLHRDREKTDSDWYALKRLMDREAIAKVQRTAKIKYLEYILEHISEHRDSIYLEILIARLKALESYLDDASKTDGDYQVNYASVSCNLKEIFARAEAFDSLPIIPIIEGGLGEVRDDNKEELNFIFGLKLKLAGKIQTEEGKTVLEYNLGLLDPDSKKHQEGLANNSKKESFVKNIIQRAVLYYFIFAGNNPQVSGYSANSDLDYDIIRNFEQKILTIFQDSDEKQKRGRLKGIINGIKNYQAETKINKLKNLFKTKIKTFKLWSSRVYPIQINVKQGILETDANTIDNRNTLFRNELEQRNQKAALKYISVSDASIDTNSLCHLSGNLKIDEIGYFETTNNQEFSMEYEIGNFPTIPIVVYPKEQRCQNLLKQNFSSQKLIVFGYQHQRLQENIFTDSQPNEAFIYRFTFSLLAYISLKILLDTATHKLKRRLFIPILKFHLSDEQDPLEEEKFMRSTFAIISHQINVNHRSNTQGFTVKNISSYKIRNGLSSLYNVLPKKFQLNQAISEPKIKKLAIMVVSSRECDRTWQGNAKKSNLIGEVIKIDRKKDGSILVYTSKTISEHYNSRQLHSEPDALVREVERLDRDGYKHILYIAKSPYSKTLNLTATESDDNLYFMSPSVIRNLKGNREDLKIYPVFFDKYYVVSLQQIGRKSLYIQDAEELTNIVNDPTKQIAVFFNLFNGIQVGRKEDRYYNGVISYSTLLNVYEQKLLDTNDIYAGLIDNDRDRGLKNEILQLLTLFHFSRYEADSKDIQLKLDPYQNIIGDKSIGALSIFPHIKPKVEFNCLAFLNEVNDALNANLTPEH